MERKVFPAIVTKADEAQGIVESIFAVFGNIDEGDDVIHPGAFTKTFAERGAKVRVLDQHRTDSIMAVLGKPLEFRELPRDQLPAGLLADVPEASGGAYAKVQFLMKTPEGQGAFERLKSGAVSEWSFGYDALDVDYSKATKGDEEITIRNLRTLKLYEISPVLFGMNPATMTASAKAAPGDEGKPYRAVQEEGRWAVYKLDEEGEPTGKPLGTHDSREEANQQIRALYAQEEDGEKAVTRSEADGQHPASHYLVVEDAQKPSTWHLRVRNAAGEVDHRLMGAAWAALHGGYRGNVYEGPGKQEAIAKLTRLYSSENMDTPGKALELAEQIYEAALEAPGEIHTFIKTLLDAPQDEAAENNQDEEEAGPDVEPPTSDDMLQLIELEELELSLMEV